MLNGGDVGDGCCEVPYAFTLGVRYDEVMACAASSVVPSSIVTGAGDFAVVPNGNRLVDSFFDRLRERPSLGFRLIMGGIGGGPLGDGIGSAACTIVGTICGGSGGRGCEFSLTARATGNISSRSRRVSSHTLSRCSFIAFSSASAAMILESLSLI